MILSSCGAARGPRRRGDDGVTSLGSAFLARGARAVVLAWADLEYGPTVDLLAAFHAHLAADEPPALALLAARRDLARDARRADLDAHSLVHVVGLGHAPLGLHAKPSATPPRSVESRSWLRALAFVAGLGLIAAAVWRLRAKRAR